MKSARARQSSLFDDSPSSPFAFASGVTSSTGFTETVIPGARSVPSHPESAVEKAVYSHIRAVRALGRKTLNTTEIAQALGLPIADVNAAVKNFEKKGVKTL